MGALWEAVTRGRPYARVLPDAPMPDTDGLALAAEIRKRAELSATRIILLTSGDRPGDLAHLRELRIDAQLLKPVPQEELLQTICRVMSGPPGNGPPTVRPAPAQEPAAGPGPAAVAVAQVRALVRQALDLATAAALAKGQVALEPYRTAAEPATEDEARREAVQWFLLAAQAAAEELDRLALAVAEG